jgi:hypothetical protein
MQESPTLRFTPNPLHTVNSDRALHDRSKVGKSQIMLARAKRKRSWAARID